MPPRSALAVIAGVMFLVAWVAASLVLSDHVASAGTAVQFAYFALAGCLWVLPVTGLIVWAARSPKRRSRFSPKSGL